MFATKAAAAERLMEIAFNFQRILLDYVHHEPETAAPSGESVRERYTRQEAEASLAAALRACASACEAKRRKAAKRQ